MVRSTILAFVMTGLAHAAPVSLSGIYPSLAVFNDEGECGVGAVVPWADRLWVVTYAPHAPQGSSDKLYEITPDLRQIVRQESIGGTPANRMIHKESNQLFLGPYAIDAQRQVRVIRPSDMFGRLTANARHLTDPANKIYFATMEEGIYEVSTNSLAVTELWRDEQRKDGRHADLPGYHGKGLYSGQGRLIYANNGDHADAALREPATPSGVLAEWDGKADQWTIVRRNQFTEVTGPGGITGNPHPETDPVWAIGWDHRSLLLMCLDDGQWHAYRLPKGSHSYDGAHGWNTEWPRIRDIGEDHLLMTMHGTFWRFPKTFTSKTSAGIAPRSNYLKVIGDFCNWNGRLVFGCDDTAHNEFLNRRAAKGKIAAPQSQSNLWFVEPTQLDHLGPTIGRGAVWLHEAVKANAPSDPYLLAGYRRKGLHFAVKMGPNSANAAVTLEVDERGDGNWTEVRRITIDKPYQWLDLSDLSGVWLRLTSNADLTDATACLHYANEDARTDEPAPIFAGLAKRGDPHLTGGLVRALGENKRTMALVAQAPGGKDVGYYELNSNLQLQRVHDEQALAEAKASMPIASGMVTSDDASVIYIDDAGKRWRLPKSFAQEQTACPLGALRICREVATERDLFHADGTFYELPASNAGGFGKARAVASSDLLVHDFCSFRGLFVMTGTTTEPVGNPHVVRSDDGRAGLWAGAIDDLWKLGKPHGIGGPWSNTKVTAGQPSDPYLMTGFDCKSLKLTSTAPANITAQVDLTGTGTWVDYQSFRVSGEVSHAFPTAFSAYWVRFVSDTDTTASATLTYR